MVCPAEAHKHDACTKGAYSEHKSALTSSILTAL